MSSSTSNSDAVGTSAAADRALIPKSLGVFLALFIAYNAAIGLWHPPGRFLQNQAEKNATLADDYILDAGRAHTILVGSSLTARLQENDLGPGFRNLSLAGGSAATGLQILLRRPGLPEAVLVEANVLRDPDTAFVEGRFAPMSLFCKRHFPSARAKYRPVNLLIGILKGKDKDVPPPEGRVFEALLEDQRRDHARPPDSAWMRTRLEDLARQVQVLRDSGVKVAFFSTPMHPDIEASPKAQAVNAAFKKVFPPGRYTWFDAPAGDWATGDGIHLAPVSARAYAAWLKSATEAEGF